MYQLFDTSSKRTHTMRHHFSRLVISAAFVATALGLFSDRILAQGREISPAARQAMDKGIIAVEISNYGLAIAYFEEARKLAPDSPVVYYNLGLVESQIYGRDLRAVAWYAAYLAASPDAANAAMVREEIAALLERNGSTTARLNALVNDAAAQVPKNIGSTRSRVQNTGSYGPNDTPEARQALESAQEDADLIEEPVEKCRALIAVASAQAKIGDINGAEETLAEAREMAEVMQSVRDKRFALIDISHVQVRMGNPGLSGPGRRVASVAPAAKRPIPPVVTAGEWLKILDDTDPESDRALNTSPFLDLAGYLRAMPSPDDPRVLVASLRDTAKKMSDAQGVIQEMLQRPQKTR